MLLGFFPKWENSIQFLIVVEGLEKSLRKHLMVLFIRDDFDFGIPVVAPPANVHTPISRNVDFRALGSFFIEKVDCGRFTGMRIQNQRLRSRQSDSVQVAKDEVLVALIKNDVLAFDGGASFHISHLNQQSNFLIHEQRAVPNFWGAADEDISFQ